MIFKSIFYVSTIYFQNKHTIYVILKLGCSLQKIIFNTNRAKKISLSINLIITILLISNIFLFFYSINYQKESIINKINTINDELQFRTKSAINSLSYLNISMQKLLMFKDNIILNDSLKVHNLDSDGNFGSTIKDKVSISGFGGLSKNKDVLKEIELAFLLTSEFDKVKRFNKAYEWVYYCSSNKFIAMYPYVSSEEFIFSKKDLKKDYYLKGLPKYNPNGDIFYTPLYFDSAGAGLMVTIGYPIYNTKKYMGNIDIDMTLDANSELLNAIDSKDIAIAIVNQDNQIIGAANLKNFDNKVINYTNNFFNKNLLSLGNSSNKLQTFNNKYYYINSFKGAPWRLIATVSRSSIMFNALLLTIPIFIIIILLYFISKSYKKIILEVQKNIQVQKQLVKSEKLAAMGEMIGNIAHQWRQPLSVISTTATGMQMQSEFGGLSTEKIYKSCEMINDNAQYLSKTIEDFTNFIKGNRQKIIFNLSDSISCFLSLVDGTIKKENILIKLDLQENININGFQDELSQCFINIFNNAKDALVGNNIQNKMIFINTKIKNNQIIIEIKDNAKGIPLDVIDKIFEPYFTTKHQSQGTGLGLHMTYSLIVDGMNGIIEASNVKYIYNKEEYEGAKFKITLTI